MYLLSVSVAFNVSVALNCSLLFQERSLTVVFEAWQVTVSKHLKVWRTHFSRSTVFWYVWFCHVEVNVFTPIFIVSKAFVLICASSHVFCFSSCPDSWWNCKVSDRKHARQYNYAWGPFTSSDTRQESTSADGGKWKLNEWWQNEDWHVYHKGKRGCLCG